MLRSVKSLEGNTIGATDGTIGKLKDFYFDDEAWVIRYAVVDTSASTVTADLTRQSIKDAPVYDDNALLDRTAEMGLYRHYGREAYWQNDGLRAEIA